MKFKLQRLVLLMLCLVCAQSLMAKPKLPDWLAEAVKRPVPAEIEKGKWDSIILHGDSAISLSEDGRQTEICKFARRIQNEDGREEAYLDLSYLKKGGKVKSLKAWLIEPNGDITTYDRDDFLEVEAAGDQMYTEYHRLVLNLTRKGAPGTVVAMQYEVMAPRTTPEGIFPVGSDVPCLLDRLTVTVPKGWELTYQSFLDPKVTYKAVGNVHEWTGTNLPGLYSDEYWAPTVDRRQARIAYKARPPAGTKKCPYALLDSWSDVAAYDASFMDPAVVVDESIKAKALELTRDATSNWEKLRALARYVQDVNYISVHIDAARDGGLRPFPAPEVLRRNYGDCKDKTALMRALASSLGFETYAVGALIGTQQQVEDSFPSTWQFNHCITAIKVDDSAQGPAVIEHPDLGRLVIFDGTDAYTPLGCLASDHEEGRLLIARAGETGLVELPKHFPKSDVDVLNLTLDAEGWVDGTLTSRLGGTAAARRRALLKIASAKDLEEALTAAFQRWCPRAILKSINYEDDLKANVATRTITVELPRYGRHLGDGVLLFKPNVSVRSEWRPSRKEIEERTQPVRCIANVEVTETDIKLPEGYVIEDMPKDASMDTDFLSFEIRYSFEEGVLRVRRKWVARDAEVPASEFAKVAAFFEAYSRATQTTVTVRPGSGTTVAQGQ